MDWRRNCDSAVFCVGDLNIHFIRNMTSLIVKSDDTQPPLKTRARRNGGAFGSSGESPILQKED